MEVLVVGVALAVVVTALAVEVVGGPVRLVVVGVVVVVGAVVEEAERRGQGNWARSCARRSGGRFCSRSSCGSCDGN